MTIGTRTAYPLADRAPETVLTPNGIPLDQLTVEGVVAGRITATDLAITSETLLRQAGIARAVDRRTLAENFERAAELVGVPEAVILQIYEQLRPGRCRDAQELKDRAMALRRDYGAEKIARLIEEAADVYERRGLFEKRF